MCVFDGAVFNPKATEEDLTEEYREERDKLMAKLKTGLVPKEKNGIHSETLTVIEVRCFAGRPITGPELATLLEILVTAANEGSLAEVL